MFGLDQLQTTTTTMFFTKYTTTLWPHLLAAAPARWALQGSPRLPSAAQGADMALGLAASHARSALQVAPVCRPQPRAHVVLRCSERVDCETNVSEKKLSQ